MTHNFEDWFIRCALVLFLTDSKWRLSVCLSVCSSDSLFVPSKPTLKTCCCSVDFVLWWVLQRTSRVRARRRAADC